MNIRDRYIELFTDIREKRYIIFFSVTLFAAAFAVSVISPSPLVKSMLMTMVKSLQGMAKELQHQPLIFVIINLFIHNALALLVAMVMGGVFILFPIISIVSNGYVTGAIVIPNLSHLGLIVPHGLFEFPAFFIATSYAIWLGLWPYRANRIERLKARVTKSLFIYAYVVVPLLIVAAIIEGILFKYFALP